MSVLCLAYLLPNLWILLKATSALTFEKLKLCGLNAFLMADTFGWLRNFIIAFKGGWEMHSAEKSNIFEFQNFQVFYYVRKKRI